MKNAVWFCFMMAFCAAVWFVPREVAPLIVWGAWVMGTWWGYIQAQGERE